MEWLAVAVGCLAVGVCLGLSGYGGFLVPPLLVWVLALSPREAVAHALLASLVPALVGAALYRRDHRVPGRLVLLLCAGTLPGVLLGELLTRSAPPRLLQVLIGLAVLGAGAAMVLPALRAAARRRTPTGVTPAGTPAGSPGQAPGADAAPGREESPARAPVPVAAGALSGVAGVVTGVGGPLVTTPVLVSTGTALGPAVGAGLVNAAVVAALGSLTLAPHVDLQAGALAAVALPQVAGVVLGVRWRSRVPTAGLTRAVAVVAVVSGIVFVATALT